MKLKRLPEDFRVVELSDFRPTPGPFALYRLTKTGLGTPEAVAAIIRRWQLVAGTVSYGGLKDRHAVTEQFLTIHGGPARPFEQEHLRLEYLGQADRPFEPSDISGNRFDLTLRDLPTEDRARIADNLHQLTRDGVPNYFDDQRFGSLGVSGEFIARAWCAGDWERTLWLALAESNRHDSPRAAQQKQLLNDQWGNWRLIADELGRPQSHADEQLAQVVRHLVAASARLSRSNRTNRSAAARPVSFVVSKLSLEPAVGGAVASPLWCGSPDDARNWSRANAILWAT